MKYNAKGMESNFFLYNSTEGQEEDGGRKKYVLLILRPYVCFNT